MERGFGVQSCTDPGEQTGSLHYYVLRLLVWPGFSIREWAFNAGLQKTSQSLLPSAVAHRIVRVLRGFPNLGGHGHGRNRPIPLILVGVSGDDVGVEEGIQVAVDRVVDSRTTGRFEDGIADAGHVVEKLRAGIPGQVIEL